MSAAVLVQSLAEFAREMELEYADAEALPPESQAIVLCAIRDCRTDLANLFAAVERDLISNAGEKRFIVEGVGEVEIKRGMKRTGWRHDELVPAVVARIVDEPETLCDTETGELHPPAVIGHNVANRLRECVSFGAGKVTGLRPLGLQSDEFCHEEPKAWSVKLPPRQT